MASSRAGEVAIKCGSSPKCKWIFSKEEMMHMASIREGLDEFKELQLRQQSTKFIQLLGDRLNLPLRDQRGKITQLCMCAAMIHMHRFFYFHSFTFFDYRDVAAACLFLSGKSEECPRKIDHIVKAWWSEKFPGIKLDQQKYEDAMGLLVAIESIILQTIAFDLQVALPHPLVLKAMHAIAKSEYNRKITEVVYFFSTDVLCVTSWGIRYSAEAIAVACVHIVCAWANFEMPASVDGSKWYQKTDPTMTEEQLQEMMLEFITVYRSCKDDLAITKFIKKGEIRDPISDGEADRITPPALMDAKEMRLPPPPPPPLSLASKKVDINAYKERRAADGGTSTISGSHHHGGSSIAGSAHHQQSQQRRNFMPEISTVKGVTASMPGFVLPKQEPVDRKLDIKHELKHEESPYRSSSSSQRPTRPPSNGGTGVPALPQQRSSLNPYIKQEPSGSGSDRSMGGERSRDSDRERSEKRKRELSVSNHNSEKRSRTDMPMSSSGGQPHRGHSTMPISSSQQQSHGYNSVPPPPLMQQSLQPPCGSNNKPYSGGNSMSTGHHHHQQQRSSYQQGMPAGYATEPPPSYGGHHGHRMQNGYGGIAISPPPPPPIATSGNDMEDGEVF